MRGLQEFLCSHGSACVAVLGASGSGKTSFINSVASGLASDIVQLASAGHAGGYSTCQAKMYSPLCAGGQPVAWTLMDVPGAVMQA